MNPSAERVKSEDENTAPVRTPIRTLAAKMEPFDSFWEAPEDIEKGYRTFYQFYKCNYLKHLSKYRNGKVLVISCGPGYFVNLLKQEGFADVLGIDSSREKISYARQRNLNCQVQEAFLFLEGKQDEFDVIFCEQEINHLTKDEAVEFLKLCRKCLRTGGLLIIHGLNGANPITGSESLAQNIDHFNTLTEYSMKQLLEYAKFVDIKIIPLNLYVFYKNPLNYALIVLDKMFALFFRISFMLYGKSNKIFTKKIAGICRKGEAVAA